MTGDIFNPKDSFLKRLSLQDVDLKLIEVSA
jgi:hypothetical protein